MILTEGQLKALEKAKDEREACGEVDTEHPGYLSTQDTFSVCTLNGVEGICRKASIDTHSKVVFLKLYDRKAALVAAELFNDRVVTFFEEHGAPRLRILTDRGFEYCSTREYHAYQLCLTSGGTQYIRTKSRSPQTNRLCERFERAIVNQFYHVVFRTTVYQSIVELQAELDAWNEEYHEQKPHSGKYCYRKTPCRPFGMCSP